MSRTWIGALAMAVLIGITVSAAPEISVDTETYDFGFAMEGSFVRHVFVITNTGNETLEISRVRSTCGCTTTALPTNSLAPGQSTEVEVSFDTAGYGGRATTKSLYIESNDPQTPQKWISMTGEVGRLGPNHIAQTDLQYLLSVMIDLRSLEEYAEGHIIGAINIPFSQLGQYVELLPSGLLMILYDEDGTLSDQAVETLIQNGYRDAKSLFGGYTMWVENMGTEMIWPPQAGDAYPLEERGHTEGSQPRHRALFLE